ncbi:MAG TPA: BolA/IbaG family iron-sulfur metabolism protein [Steroidobacteraceae bacterium]|jgi:BolA protein|nr:BolA/IbaG family iron-sulfur metabolism protein [Steroidobacteraceae bacterium]
MSSPGSGRLARIEQCLRDALQPSELQVQDHSAAHAGHAGAASGKGHFSARIVSERFTGLSVLQRHRLVNQALTALWDSDLHAMSITALTSDELTI